MSETNGIGIGQQVPAPAASGLHQAIAGAAARTGTDFDYLFAQAKIESGLNPTARATTSSASGLYQFIDSTWLSTLRTHGGEHGYGAYASAIGMNGDTPFVADPAMRGRIMALRMDPQASALMAGELANDNRAALMPVLGRQPDHAELYLAHFLGAKGAGQFLSTLQSNPSASAAGLLPKAAGANRAIFYNAQGGPRSVGEVMQVIRGKVSGAMQGGAMPQGYGFTAAQAHYTNSFTPAQQAPAAPAMPAAGRLPSMAETLRSSFALGEPNSTAGRHVQNAYAKLEAFGL